MYKLNGQLIFSPSDLIVFMESDFASWMDRFHLEFPGEITPDESDETMKLLQQRGGQHESDYLKLQKRSDKRVCEIASGPGSREQTLAALRQGHEIIYQASLARDNFAGYADFLCRTEGPSNLGDYHYEVRDTKL